MNVFLQIAAWFMTVLTTLFSFIGVDIDMISYPNGKQLDLTGYELVFEDQFEGDSINTDIWSFSPAEGAAVRGATVRYANNEVRDGALIMHLRQEADGTVTAPPDVRSIDTKEFVRGYFECRCILPKVQNGCGAFWMMNHPEDMHDHVELDVMENQSWGPKAVSYYRQKFGDIAKNSIEHNIHVAYTTDSYKKLRAHAFLVKGDPYNEYHTYGLLWEKDKYTFFIDGVATMSTKLGLTELPEYLLLSNYVRESNYLIDNGDAQFIVDYVKVYQIP